MQGCKKMAVASYDEIEKVQDIGNSNRTVGATLMNACADCRPPTAAAAAAAAAAGPCPRRGRGCD